MKTQTKTARLLWLEGFSTICHAGLYSQFPPLQNTVQCYMLAFVAFFFSWTHVSNTEYNKSLSLYIVYTYIYICVYIIYTWTYIYIYICAKIRYSSGLYIYTCYIYIYIPQDTMWLKGVNLCSTSWNTYFQKRQCSGYKRLHVEISSRYSLRSSHICSW